jgi:hypothetical protein
MPAYLKQAPTGIPGDVTRTDGSNVEPAMLVALAGVYPTAYGQAAKYVTGGVQQFSGVETKADFAGVLVREVPSTSGSSADDLTYGSRPYPSVPQGMLVRGYVSVLCAAGTPARGGVVYVQITTDGSITPGMFRADGTDGGKAIALDAVQAEWATDGLDSSGNAELRVAR